MKVVALISWWEESPAWLAATVSSAAKLCDHVVAVDGAYALMPAGTARSEPTQAEVVLRTCDALSLFFCLNEPGVSTWPWYRDGVAFGDERLDVRWDGPERVVIEPDPLVGPVTVTVPWRRIDGLDQTVDAGVLSVTLGGTDAATR